jgi:hypothetical protein
MGQIGPVVPPFAQRRFAVPKAVNRRRLALGPKVIGGIEKRDFRFFSVEAKERVSRHP